MKEFEEGEVEHQEAAVVEKLAFFLTGEEDQKLDEFSVEFSAPFALFQGHELAFIIVYLLNCTVAEFYRENQLTDKRLGVNIPVEMDKIASLLFGEQRCITADPQLVLEQELYVISVAVDELLFVCDTGDSAAQVVVE